MKEKYRERRIMDEICYMKKRKGIRREEKGRRDEKRKEKRKARKKRDKKRKAEKLERRKLIGRER